MGNDTATNRRIAVIAVHGVSDQKLGDTAQVLAELLVSQAPNAATYDRGHRSDVLLQVTPLDPVTHLATTAGGIRKDLRQSWRSDYLRREGTAAGRARMLDAKWASVSQGVEFTSYLLAKAKNNGVSTETFTMPVISLLRRDDQTSQCVDIFEMYWADLSRLASNIPTILTELFTFLFRLSMLGRDTVQIQASTSQFAALGEWRVLKWCQAALDWMYSRILALLFLQLVVLALILVPFGLVWQHPKPVYLAVCALLVIAAVSATLYYSRKPALSLLLGCVLAYLLSAVEFASAWVVGSAWLIGLGFAYDAWLRVCEERFPLVRPPGIVLGLVSLLGVVYFAARAGHSDLQMWIIGALSAVEITLLLIVIWWFAAGCLMVPWLVAGTLATRGRVAPEAGQRAGAATSRAQARGAVATGRMGLVVSIGFFIVLSMTAWALITTAVDKAVEGVQYTPLIFGRTTDQGKVTSGVQSTATQAANPATAPPASQATNPKDDPCNGLENASLFLCQRYVNSTETFALITVILSALIAYLVLMLLPSMVTEMDLAKLDGPRLGLWLTRGFRWVERVLAILVLLGVIAAFVLGIVLIAFRLLAIGIDVKPVISLANLADEATGLSKQSHRWLSYFVIAAGSTFVALTALSRLLSRYVPWLRAPLDAALDVDNHFREFPRKAIPRARIFSRYAAVLRHIANNDYERIVIVAHSQGTVISAEMLRYLKEAAAMGPDGGPFRSIWDALQGKIMVVTAGCPLRQLYAARFPVLYDWVLLNRAGTFGPTAADIGANAWANVFTTGDYVGRWLWSRPPSTLEYPPSQIDERDAKKAPTYDPQPLDTTDWRRLMGGDTEKDISLGAGAHTHYFQPPQKIVADVIDAMMSR